MKNTLQKVFSQKISDNKQFFASPSNKIRLLLGIFVFCLKSIFLHFCDMSFRNEKEIGKKAEQLLQSSLRSTAQGSFKEHYLKTDEGKKRIRDAAVKAVVRKYKFSKKLNLPNNEKEIYFLNVIKIEMMKYGFIQHYGIDNIRAGGFRHRETPRSIDYHYKPHQVNMKATPWIGVALERSEIIGFISTEVSKIRGEEILLMIKKSIEKGEL